MGGKPRIKKSRKGERRPRWQSWEDDILREEYPVGDIIGCHKRLPHRTRRSIDGHRAWLGIPPNKPQWTQEEDALLQQLLLTASDWASVAESMGRTASSVSARAADLALCLVAANKEWTREDDNILRRCYKGHTGWMSGPTRRAMSLLPRRGYKSILARAVEIGVRVVRARSPSMSNWKSPTNKRSK